MTAWGNTIRWAMATWAVVLALAILAPSGVMLLASLEGENGPSLAAYSNVLATPRQLGLFAKSLALAAGTTLLALTLGVPIGFALARIDVPLRRFWYALLVLPLVLPPYLFAVAWIDLLAPGGLFERLASAIPGPNSAAPNAYNLWGAIWVLGLCYFPLAAMLTSFSFRNADAAQEEAARLYTGWRRTLFTVTLRQALPAVLASAALIFVLALGRFGVPSLLHCQVYTTEVFARFSAFYDVPGAAATALPLVLLAAAVLLPFERYQDGARLRFGARALRPAPPLPIGRWRWGFGAGMAAVFLVALILPAAALMLQAGGPAAYLHAFKSAWPELRNSAAVAAAAASAMLLAALPAAYFAARAKSLPAALVSLGLLLSFAVPGTVLGIGLIKLCNGPGLLGTLYGSPAILVVAAAARFMAVLFFGARLAIGRIDPALEEAAAVSGISWPRTWIHVVLPRIAPSLAALWLLAFVLTAGELSASVLVSPPGFTTIATRLFSLMHYGVNELVAALAIMLMAAVGLPILTLATILQRKRDPGRAPH